FAPSPTRRSSDLDNGVVGAEAEPLCQRRVARRRVAEQLEVDSVGRDYDLVRLDSAPDEVAAQAFTDNRCRIGAADRAGFKKAGETVAQAPFAPRAVPDRRILPECADFVEHWDSKAFADAQRCHRIEYGRMRMKQIRSPFTGERFHSRRQRTDLAPFANRRSCGRNRRGPVE